ncbi:MAG: carbamoyltransferase HypF [Candidatus Solibacter usitatus]|nr:carbamoyltransferase HypF [Candidatus Solibacter usitatus]
MDASPMRLRIRITGAVQGVGFRPHVYRLARARGLAGYVLNSIQGVCIEVEGPTASVEAFQEELRAGPPANAVVSGFSSEAIAEQGGGEFAVRHSDSSGEPAAYLLPDLAICTACLKDIGDPRNRRYRYPFTTCTHCGPRYSIVRGLPYDRPQTSMDRFPMCPACLAEYTDPADRRFHAQTNCCADCGPRLTLCAPAGQTLAAGHEALLQTSQAVRDGRIVALKGIGGFHLICDARNAAVITELRRRKRRPTKPFAVMAPSWPASEEALQLLRSPQAPIVLVEHDNELPDEIAPGNPFLGLMLPYSPLHTLLLDELGFAIVATSGNLSDEPICIDNGEALHRLGAVADLFLMHDRPILRPVDDSIVRFIGGQPVLLRRARGYAPLPLPSPVDLPELLATGAHMKNTVAFSRGRLVFVSQHLGDLSTLPAVESHRRALSDMRETYQLRPTGVACDLHPDYGSTRSAESLGLPVTRVQHHEAHVLAGVLEHHIEAPLLGVSWDGSGYGTDATVWGGEFLLFDGARCRRIAHLRPFSLPGGEQAVREPRRALLGLLHEIGREELARHLFQAAEWQVLESMLARRLNCPATTSAGRLFDAAAALLGLCPVSSFEGEAAMRLEFAARRSNTSETVECGTDWQPLIEHLASAKGSIEDRAAVFHHALVGMIVGVARKAAIQKVLLTGGCFQNALLTEQCSAALGGAGFKVYTHQALPPNDGAVAAGQILAAALRSGGPPCA